MFRMEADSVSFVQPTFGYQMARSSGADQTGGREEEGETGRRETETACCGGGGGDSAPESML